MSFAASPVYLVSIVRGRTKPDRVTWWVVAFVSAMIAAEYHAVGARETLWLPIEYAVSFVVIAAFSVRYGDGPLSLHVVDRVCVAGAVLSGVIWWAGKSPWTALLASMATDFIGVLPTIVKVYGRPRTEDRFAWIVGTAASGLNVLALTSFTPTLSVYPIYVFVANACILALILRPAHCPAPATERRT